MTEDEAREWLADHIDVSRETWAALDRFAALIRTTNERQNLVAASTLPSLWGRHIVDSAQLVPMAPQTGKWLDLGSGPGLPGLVVAALRDAPVTLVESRRLRVEFLNAAAEAMGIASRVTVVGKRLEQVDTRMFEVISARAFAPLPRLLPLAARFAHDATLWLLPKGRSAVSELEAVAGTWQGDFRVEPSVTDPEAAIIVARGVQPVGKRSKGKR